MGNPLLVFWKNLLGPEDDERRVRRATFRVAAHSAAQASATIFLILRRMRAPLIVLIMIFAVSVLGLTLIPGQDADGNPVEMGFFDAFYVMSYTASTIGFGEIPHPWTYNQRMWVTISIYLTVIGWAYAIGSLLALLQDRAFRSALALQHFSRKVSRLREPFLLIAGYGRTGELLGHSFDALGRRFVVLDRSSERIEGLELDSYHADVPGLAADARDPGHLAVAGLGHACCEAVVALTDDEEANLAIVMAAELLRPELPVIARVTSRTIAERMQAFGSPSTVNAFDRFGDHLRLALRAPAAYQLLTWLESGPGAELPERGSPPRSGRWIICGYGRLGRELTADLRAEGLKVTVIDADPTGVEDGVDLLVGDGSDPWVMAQADLDRAVGLVAGTDNDTTNLSLVAAARRSNPALFLAARQNQAASAPLFAAMEIDALLVPTEVIAHEVYAQLSTPLLWRFLRELPAMGDAWAAELVERLTSVCGTRLQALWKVRLTPEEAPALGTWLASGEARLTQLLRNPEDRDEPLHALVLIVLRDREAILAPDENFILRPGDELLLAGWPAARRALGTILVVDGVLDYLVTGRRVPSSWIWRRLRPPPEAPVDADVDASPDASPSGRV
jgi:Trk K+ transport system NAD-binding subunit